VEVEIPAVVVGLLLNSGCAFFGAGHTSSPWEWGVGGRIAPGFTVGQGSTTVHPMGGYTYLKFSGGNDQLFEFGGQVRQSLPKAGGGPGVWVGGEAAFARLRTSAGGFSSSTNGWAVTGLAGLPVGQGEAGASLFAAAGLSNYGSSGFNIRAGVDVQPSFLKRGR
jgi:hypothetical protein